MSPDPQVDQRLQVLEDIMCDEIPLELSLDKAQELIEQGQSLAETLDGDYEKAKTQGEQWVGLWDHVTSLSVM